MGTDAQTNKNFSVQSKQKKIAVWVITPNGLAIADKIKSKFNHTQLFVSKKLAANYPVPDEAILFSRLASKIQEEFTIFDNHVFVFSTGIAVRVIAPLLESKLKDPAVVVIDDHARHCISLVSGHIGGANQLAETISALTGSRPVITTATDINHLSSIDMISKANNLVIENPEMIKTINMSFLMEEKIHLIDPQNLVCSQLDRHLYKMETEVTSTGPSVFCSHETKPVSRETLILRPQVLSVGIGCNRGTTFKEIKAFLMTVFKKKSFSTKAILTLASTDVKTDETGLIELSENLNLPIAFYDKKTLNSVETIENPSEMVEKHLGVKSVCEAAAILSAGNGPLIIPKQKKGNVTLAVAIKEQNSM